VRWQNIPQPPQAYSPLCPGDKAASEPSLPISNPQSLMMTSPDQGSHYRLSAEIPSSAQQVVVTARPVNGISLHQVTLLVDGVPLATLSAPPYQALWPMTVGTHTFTALGVNEEGNEIEGNTITIEVRE